MKRNKLCATSARALAASLAAVLLISGSAVLPSSAPMLPTASATDVDELRDKRQELLDKQEELRNKRNASAATLEEFEAEKEVIQQQIDAKIAEIEVRQELVDKLDAQIADKEYEIAVKQQAIDLKEAEIADRFEELRVRLRAISKTGTVTSMLQMILSADGYSDYLLKSKAMERISSQNEKLMNELDAELQVINNDKALLEADKAAFEEEKKPLVAEQTELLTKKQELDVLYSEKLVVTEELNKEIDNYNAAIAEAQADADALQAEINKAIAQQYNSSIYNQSGTMLWPAPTCNYISSTYKWRWGRLHAGIDICGSGCYGSPIVAAADGVVSLAGWCGGYGYCVMIDHGTNSSGKNVTTVYAHACKQPSVSVGQKVNTGDVIAYIGSTGNSTGPHLHFEVRVGGSAVNPIANGYVSTAGIIVDESL